MKENNTEKITTQEMEQFIEMCFDPTTETNKNLKETLKKLMEENNK